MLLDTLDALGTLADVRKVVLASPEDDGVSILRNLVSPAWEIVPQRGHHLGERLAHGFIDLHEGGNPVVIIGSDSPTLPIAAIAVTLREFFGAPRALLGPADDGGYYLIGLTVLELDILRDISWSTSIVAEQTRARMRELRLAWDELPGSYDVDTPSDLERLRAELMQSPHLAPRCARILGCQ